MIQTVGIAIWNYCCKSGMTQKQLEIVSKAMSDYIERYYNGDPLENIHVSRGNRKIGKMLNFSLLPGFTCGYWAKKTCLCHGCYALKENRYPAVLYNRVQNTIAAVMHPNLIRKAFDKAIKEYKPEYIRLHEAGDFVTDLYLDMILCMCDDHRNVKVYTYTKQYERIQRFATDILVTDNLEIKVSTWQDLPGKAKNIIAKLIAKGFAIAALQGDEFEQHENTAACLNQVDGRTCSECGLCMIRKNIRFKKH